MVDLAILAELPPEAEAIGGGVMITGGSGGQVPSIVARMKATLEPGTPVALSGVAYGLQPELRPGAVVVATELRATDGTSRRRLPAALLVASDHRSLGLQVLTG